MIRIHKLNWGTVSALTDHLWILERFQKNPKQSEVSVQNYKTLYPPHIVFLRQLFEVEYQFFFYIDIKALLVLLIKEGHTTLMIPYKHQEAFRGCPFLFFLIQVAENTVIFSARSWGTGGSFLVPRQAVYPAATLPQEAKKTCCWMQTGSSRGSIKAAALHWRPDPPTQGPHYYCSLKTTS